MQEVLDFIKNCHTYYLATVEGDQPRVRPFGTFHLFEGKLYLQTGKVKKVAGQMLKNPKVEICACDGDHWLRIAALAIEDDRTAARVSMLEAYPQLQGRYQADDGNCAVFYLQDAVATFYSRTEEPRVVRF